MIGNSVFFSQRKNPWKKRMRLTCIETATSGHSRDEEAWQASNKTQLTTIDVFFATYGWFICSLGIEN